MHPTPELPDRYSLREVLADEPAIQRLRMFDATLQREVLLEFPGPLLRERFGTSQRDRILCEARVRARVEHPGVQRMREVLEIGDVPILVLEPVAGESLESILAQKGHLEPAAVIDLGVQVARAVQAIHAAGAVHRDVAAHNILCDGSRAVVRGLVFAKPIDGFDATSLDYGARHRPDVVAALPKHPAPEQVSGQPADARADVFGLGCVLYQALTGQPAFLDSYGEWREPVSPRDLVAGVPRGLCDVVLRCLRPAPLNRYPTMLEVAEALETQRAAAAPAAPVDRRARARIGIAVVVVLLGVLVWGWSTASRSDKGNSNPPPVPPAHRSYLDHYTGGFALLIPIEYKNRAGFQLTRPRVELEKIKARLEALNWQAVIQEDTSAAGLRNALATLNKRDRDEQVLVYFSGHGIISPAGRQGVPTGYAVPADFELDPEGRPEVASCVGFRRIEDAVLREGTAKHAMLVLDCCHSGSTPLASKGGERPLMGRAKLGYTERHGVVVTVCGSYEETSEWSSFAARFTALLDRAAKGEEIWWNQLYEVRREMPRSCTVVSDGEGDFVFKVLPK